jgi:hypothetical protein
MMTRIFSFDLAKKAAVTNKAGSKVKSFIEDAKKEIEDAKKKIRSKDAK